MADVLNNITDSHYGVSFLGDMVCLSKQEIIAFDANKFKFTTYGGVLQYVQSCNRLNIINPSIIHYLDEAFLEKDTLLSSRILYNYMRIRFLNYEHENKWEGEWNDCYPFLRINLFMTNEFSSNYDYRSYMDALDYDTMQNGVTLVNPTIKNARILNHIEDMSFLKKGAVDPNMHDNTLDYIAASSKYVMDFASIVNTDTKAHPHLTVKNGTVCSLWFMLHENNIKDDNILLILDKAFIDSGYNYLEYVWEYSYTKGYTEITEQCITYLSKLDPFYTNGYSNVNPTFFDYLYEVALNNNCLTPEFISFINIRKIMLLFNDKTMEINQFKDLFKSYYENLRPVHKINLAVHAAHVSTIAPFSKNRRDIIYPFIHKIHYTEETLDDAFPIPFADFFYYTVLEKKVPASDSNYITWICTKSTNIIEYMLTAHSPPLRDLLNKDSSKNLFII